VQSQIIDSVSCQLRPSVFGVWIDLTSVVNSRAASAVATGQSLAVCEAVLGLKTAGGGVVTDSCGGAVDDGAMAGGSDISGGQQGMARR